MLIQVTIEGLSPLLMNRFPDGDPSGKNRPSIGGEKGTPREQAEPKLYALPGGRLYIPGPNLFAAIIAAGSFMKVGKRQLTTMKTSLIPGGVAVVEPECPLESKNGKGWAPTQEWEVDSRPVVIPSTGGRIICHRPRLDTWRVKLTLDVDTSEFDERTVRDLVDIAGRKIGLLDFRPARKGPFGRFVVVAWERLEDEGQKAA